MRPIFLLALAFLPMCCKANTSFASFDPKNFVQDSSFSYLKSQVIHHLEGSWCSKEKADLIMNLLLFEKPEICVEIGVFNGSSLLPIASTLKYLNHGTVYAIDAWSNKIAIQNMDENDPNKPWWSTVSMSDAKNSFYQMLKHWELEPFCKVISTSSEKACEKIPTIDFLHLDGDYSEKGSLQDVTLYLPKVKKGGYILISNLYIIVNKKYPKQKAFAHLFESCEVITRIENGNAVLLQKL